ncbi:MAG: TonB-dependent receptor [Asticcacaulis sp.]|uniref:TonB-dependent receptor n=1 Tax=Asticcacaulis sp. TaxID=1872648 RepID=UPI0039E56FEE
MTFKDYALLSTALAGLLTASSVMAQEVAAPAASSDAATEVVVTGFRKSLATALQTKRRDIRVSDGISAEDLGKFPSDNIAEAIQRIPGVQIQNVNGRGATISVRGLGPQYAKVTINGQDFANPNFIDGFRFDIIQTELASAVNVYKSPTADMDMGGLAGTIDISTAKPLDIKGEKLIVTAKAQESTLADAGVNPAVGITYANQYFGGKLGIYAGANYQELDDRADYLFMDRWYTSAGTDGEYNGGTATPAGTLVPRRFRYRRIDRTSDRTQFNLGVEYKASDNLKLGLAGVYSKDATKYDVTQLVFGNFSQSSITPVTVENGVATVVNLTNFGYDNNRQLETRDLSTQAYTAYAKWNIAPDWTLNATAHYTKGDGYLTEEAAITGYGEASGTLDISDPDNIKFTVSGDPASTDQYESSNITWSSYPNGAQNHQVTDSTSAQVDLKWDANIGVWKDLKFGIKAKRETFMRYVTRRDYFDDNLQYVPTVTSSSPIVTDFLNGGVSGVTSWYTPDIAAYKAALAAAGVTVETLYNPQDSYSMARNISSAYVMADFAGNLGTIPYRANAGVRYEATSQSVTANITDGCDCDIQGLLGTETTTMKYNNALPSANIAFDLTDTLVLRLAAAKTLVRPILDSSSRLNTSQYSATDTSGITTVYVDQGSPTLKPMTAMNLDIGLEWYYSRNAGFSFGAFAKDVKNGTYTQLVCPATWDGVSLSLDATTNDCIGTNDKIYQINVTKNDASVVKLRGAEINWQSSLDFVLPIKGFGVQANYTYVDPQYTDDGFSLRNLSKNSGNLTGYWENEKISARISANYRSSYEQTSVDSFFAREGHTIKGGTQVDFSFGYTFNPHVSLTVTGQNIFNKKEEAYKNSESIWQETGVFGPSYQIGLTYKM